MPKQNNDFTAMREAMIDSQLRTSGVNNAAIIGRMRSVPREDFVASNKQAICYMDRSIAVGDDRYLNPPVAHALMLQHAAPLASDHVLLVGLATGYLAAVLSPLVQHIVALEESAVLMSDAQSNLLNMGNIELVTGALTQGHAAPELYSLIIVDGAVEILPEAILVLLRERGRIISGIKNGPVTSLAYGVKHGGHVALRPFIDIGIAPLNGFARKQEFAF